MPKGLSASAPVHEHKDDAHASRLNTLKISNTKRQPLNISLHRPSEDNVDAFPAIISALFPSFLITSLSWFVVFTALIVSKTVSMADYSFGDIAVLLLTPPLIITAAIVTARSLQSALLSNTRRTVSPISRPANDSLTGFDRTIPFILESLHSLSVDVTRMNEHGVSKKTWQAFQRGDSAAFTKRLTQNPTQWDGKKTRKKYKSDSVFRNTINHFIAQFETMIVQANNSDHEGLLMSTLASSEVAKLYTFLCKVAGHHSVLK